MGFPKFTFFYSSLQALMQVYFKKRSQPREFAQYITKHLNE
jgi:hypothetical protein